MSSEPSMSALVVETSDGPFRRVRRPRPDPKPGEVLVRVMASGVNPLDTKIRAGAAAHARHDLPAVLGLDLAGVVEAIGDGVERFKPGDEVYGMTGGVGGLPGSLQDYVAVDSDLLALKPKTLSMREAAAVPLVFITAWEGLVDRARVSSGQTVLVLGGAGGVGHMVVQIAKAYGAEVFATHRGGQAEVLAALGATPIDSRGRWIEDCLARSTSGGFDIAYDTGGGAMLDDAFSAVRRYGHAVSCLGWGSHALGPLSFKGASYSGVFTLLPLLTGEGRAHHGEILAEATRLAEAGQLRPRLDPRAFDLDTVEAAHDIVTAGTAQGKVVVSVA